MYACILVMIIMIMMCVQCVLMLLVVFASSMAKYGGSGPGRRLALVPEAADNLTQYNRIQ